MNYVEKIKEELKKHINEEKAAFFPRFFQAFEGGYGEGDRFLGVVVPDQRKVARKYYKLVSLKDIEKLLSEPYHECRLTALFMMVHKFEKAKDEKEREEIVNTYSTISEPSTTGIWLTPPRHIYLDNFFITHINAHLPPNTFP